MKRNEFDDLNTTKKRGNTAVVLVAVMALCLAGVLCAWKLRAESSTIFLDTGTVNMSTE